MSNSRNKDKWRMSQAYSASELASCLRSSVGCVLFDAKDRVLATGRNGPNKMEANCSSKCPGIKENGPCFATHAEVNAVAQCKEIDSIVTVACTMFPCERCLGLLLNTGMQKLLFAETYTGWEEQARRLLAVGVIYKQVSVLTAAGPDYYDNLWYTIKQRCFNPKNTRFKDYGARGILLFEDWAFNKDFFIAYIISELGPRPPGMSLDRIDNNIGYIPGNLKWSTSSEQQFNRRPVSNTGIKNISYAASSNRYQINCILPTGERVAKTAKTLDEAIKLKAKIFNEEL